MTPSAPSPRKRRRKPAKKKPMPNIVLLVTCDRHPPLVIGDHTVPVEEARRVYCEHAGIEHPDKAGATIKVRLSTKAEVDKYLEKLNGKGKDNS